MLLFSNSNIQKACYYSQSISLKELIQSAVNFLLRLLLLLCESLAHLAFENNLIPFLLKSCSYSLETFSCKLWITLASSCTCIIRFCMVRNFVILILSVGFGGILCSWIKFCRKSFDLFTTRWNRFVMYMLFFSNTFRCCSGLECDGCVTVKKVNSSAENTKRKAHVYGCRCFLVVNTSICSSCLFAITKYSIRKAIFIEIPPFFIYTPCILVNIIFEAFDFKLEFRIATKDCLLFQL